MTFPYLVLGAVGTVALAGLFARFSRQWHVAAIGASAGILVLQHFYFQYTSDDAYISYRYARNLSDGIGPVWNNGEHVEGYTNFLWVGILAGLHKLGADIVLSGRWLGFSLGIVAAAGCYVVTRELLGGTPGRVAGFIAAILLASSGAWAMWASAGLEAPLFASCTLAAVFLHIRERPRPSGPVAQGAPSGGWLPLSAIPWAFVGMARADGVLLVAVSGFFKLGDAVLRVRRAPRGQRLRTAAFAMLHVLLWTAVFTAAYAPYFIWRYNYYDWIYPNTYYAKVGGEWNQVDRGVKYVLAFLQESGGWLLLLLPLAIAESAVRRGAALYVLVLAGVWFGYTAYVGGDSLLRYRFLAPVLPLYYSVLAVTAVSVATRLRSAMPRQRYAAEAIASLAFLAAVAVTLHPQVVDAIDTRGERRAVADRSTIGLWMRDNLADDTTVAAIPVGAIGYESRLTVIDMLGITDEHIAHRKLKIGELAAGHEKYDSEYVLDRKPDIILLFDSLTEEPLGEAAYNQLSGIFIPAAIDMVSNERLFEEYDRRAVKVDGKWLNLLVRKDASSVLAETLPGPP
jgi:hypothetical protein